MKTKFIETINSYKKLFGVMEKNLEKWGHIDQFKTTYDQFVMNFKKLEDLKASLEKDSDSTSREIEKLRNEINDRLIPVSNLLDLYSVDNNKKGLKKKISDARGRIKKMSADELVKHVTEITDYAAKKIADQAEKTKKQAGIESYGLSTNLIEELREKNLNFADLSARFKAEKKEAKKAGDEIGKRIKENEKILKNRFRKFMSLFETTEPAFYKAYMDALNPVPLANQAEKTKEAKTSEKKTNKGGSTSTQKKSSTAAARQKPAGRRSSTTTQKTS